MKRRCAYINQCGLPFCFICIIMSIRLVSRKAIVVELQMSCWKFLTFLGSRRVFVFVFSQVLGLLLSLGKTGGN